MPMPPPAPPKAARQPLWLIPVVLGVIALVAYVAMKIFN
jgi:hypothetical protein